jgi:hypothetical protein
MIVCRQRVPLHLLAQLISDGDLAVLAPRLSLAHRPSDCLPVITVRILHEAPLVESSYILCFSGMMVRVAAEVVNLA